MVIYDNTGELLLDIPVDDDSYRDDIGLIGGGQMKAPVYIKRK